MARQRVLLAHGNADCRKIYSSVLSYEGYLVDEASDMDSALSHVAGGLHDLVVTDLYLPGAGDECLLRRLKGDSATAHLPVVVLTGWTTEPHREMAMELGADRFLSLPVRPRELTAIVTALVGRPVPQSTQAAPVANSPERPMANGM